MFKNTLNLTTLSEGGENFTSSSIRKKGRSLSQTSFLWTNLINIPQDLPLPNQKKTLAFAPSFQWTHSETLDFANEGYSKWANIDLKSSQNICSTNSTPDRSHQNLRFVNENELQPSVFQDESQTDLSSSYKYNPIFPENQFYTENSIGTSSSLTSYTSLKHHILENIPLNLISNLNIFFNKTHNESVISSKSSFCRVGDAISKNRKSKTKLFGISRSNDEHTYGPNPDSFKNFPSTEECQFSSFKNDNQNSFHASNNLRANIKHRKSETNFFLRSRDEHPSSLFSSSSSSSPQNQLVVLKPASDSVLTSCSSESIISSLELAREPSETTLGSESIHNEENDLRVHYINDSASDESEYSLLISKGYTFVDSTSRQDPSSVTSASSDVPETELQVVNFSEFNFNLPNAIRNQNNSGSNDWEKNLACQSKTDLKQEIFKSCHSKMRFIPKSSMRHPPQHKDGDNKDYLLCTSKSISKEKDKLERRKIKRQKRQRPPLIAPTEGNFKRTDNTSTVSEKVWPDRQNKSLRNTVKKISHRFMRIESRENCEDDSSSETYTENVSDQSQFSISEESSEKSNSEDDPLNYNTEGTKYSEYQSSVPEFKLKVIQKKRPGLKMNFDRKQKGAHFKSIPGLINCQNKDAKSEILPNRKRKNSSVSSRSTLTVKRRHSKHLVTTNSTNAHTYRKHLKRGVLKRTMVGGCNRKEEKKCTFANITSTDHARGSAKPARQLATCPEKVKWYAHDAELTPRPEKKIGASINYNSKLLNMMDEKNVQSVGSKQDILNFIGRTEIVNLNEPTESMSNNWKVSPRNEECPYTTDKKEKTNLYQHYNKVIFGKRNTKPEMDVYSRSDRKKKVLKNQRGLAEKSMTPKEVKIESSKKIEAVFQNKMETSTKFKNKIPHTSTVMAEVRDVLSATEQKDSFHSCWKENSLTATENQAELQYETKKHFSKARASLPQSFSSSTLASSYFPQDERSAVESSESEQSFSETTTEYIKWAKNCILNRNKETATDPSFGLQEKFSIADEKCITVMNPSICGATAEISDGSISTAGDKSALSVIPEENGSTEKLKSPFFSQKASAEIVVSKHGSSNSQKLLNPKLVSSSQDSLNDVIFEENRSFEDLNSPFLPQNASVEKNVSKHKSSNFQQLFNSKFNSSSQESLSKRVSSQSASTTKSKTQKRQSKKFLLSSESEGEYSRFKNELKFYHKNVSSENLPRIIPSSSTFTPDKSVTQIE